MVLDYNGAHDEHFWETLWMIEMEFQRAVNYQNYADILMLRVRFTL